MQTIFSFWFFEVSEDILRNQKNIIGLDTFYNPIRIILVFVLTTLLKLQNDHSSLLLDVAIYINGH